MTHKHRALWAAALAFVLGIATGGGPVYIVVVSLAVRSASTGAMVVTDVTYGGTVAPLYAVAFEAKNPPSGAEWSATVGTAAVSGSGPDLILQIPNGTYDWNVTPPVGDWALFTVTSGVPPDAFHIGGAGAEVYGNLTIRGSPLTISVAFAQRPGTQPPPDPIVTALSPPGVFLLFAIVLSVTLFLLLRKKGPAT